MTILPVVTPIIVLIRFSSIHDLAYFLTAGLRIFLGDIPYYDFIEVHTPGSYYLISFIFRVFGVNYLPVIFWMLFVNIISTICVYKILKFIEVEKRLIKLAIIGFALLGPYSFFAQIWYDSDSLFFLILNIFLLVFLKNYKTNYFLFFIAGVLSFLPFWFKQNIGLVTLFSISFSVIFHYKTNFKNKFAFFTGLTTGISIFLIFLHLNKSLTNWFFYNFKYASLSRFASIITDIFPIRFIKKYGFTMQFELLYYFSYLVILLICFKIFSLLFHNKKNKFIFLETFVLVFSTFVYFDNLIRNEIVDFLLNQFNLSINFMSIFQISLIVFFLGTFINYILNYFSTSPNILLNIYFLINAFYSLFFLITYINKISSTSSIEQRSHISFEYYLKLLFLIYFPVMLLSLFLSFKKSDKYSIVIIPILGYLYGTSLSQGVPGSTAASVGIVLVLYFILYDFFNKYFGSISKSIFRLFIGSTIILFFLTAVFGSRYHFITFEKEYSNFQSLSFLSIPSKHFYQQEVASKLLKKYSEDFETIVFVPEATTAYFENEYLPKVDITTFDTTTNPYGVLFNTDSIRYFLECNKVQIVIVNTNPHRKYFRQFVDNEKKRISYLGSNYVKIDVIEDFIIYKNIKNYDKNTYCNLQLNN